jgi:hypothetical protein
MRGCSQAITGDRLTSLSIHYFILVTHGELLLAMLAEKTERTRIQRQKPLFHPVALGDKTIKKPLSLNQLYPEVKHTDLASSNRLPPLLQDRISSSNVVSIHICIYRQIMH